MFRFEDMNDIIIAVIGSITTMSTALITGLLARKELKKTRAKIPEKEKVFLETSNKSLFAKIIIIVSFFVGILITFAFISAKDTWNKESKIDRLSSPYKTLLTKAVTKTDGNPYIIPSVVMNVELEKLSDSTGNHLEAIYTLVYNTVYLQQMYGTKRAFDDGFRSNRGGEVIELNGSDKQIEMASSPTSKAWNCIFPAAIGANRMTVTRFKVIYPPKLAEYNSRFFGRLTEAEEEFAYPNISNDVIGEVVMMISSKTPDLKLGDLHNAATGSIDDLNPSKWIEQALTIKAQARGAEKTIVARFPGLGDKEVAKPKIGW